MGLWLKNNDGTNVYNNIWADNTNLGPTITDADVNAACDQALADYDAPTNAEMTARTLASADYATASALATVEGKLLEVWGRLGLDPAAPLITGQTSITFGDIVMAMVGNETQTTVTRQ